MSMFDNTAPAPPPPARFRNPRKYSDDELMEAASVLLMRGWIAVPATDKREAASKSSSIATALMRSPFWIAQVGEPLPRWISARAAKDDDGCWWGYAQVKKDGTFVGFGSNGNAHGPVMVDGNGVRFTQNRRSR